MKFLNDLEEWIRTWFEDPENLESGGLANAAMVVMLLERLREAEEKK